ncbi:MAG: DnaJ domain-containing protein [Patescibacteria group bacterium]
MQHDCHCNTHSGGECNCGDYYFAWPPLLPPISTPYEVLGISANATAEEIKQAYHRKAQENHPDKVANAGEEIRKLAEERMKEINVAYDALIK